MKRRDFCRSTMAASSVAAVSLDGAEIELEKAAIRELAEELNGPLLMPGDTQYDYARRVWNGMHDRHPALIPHRCNTAW